MKRALLLACLLAAALCGTACAGEPQYLHVQMRSALLSQFWGKPVSIEAYVLLPDSYYKQPGKHYPVLYWVPGFGSDGSLDARSALRWQQPMRALHREFILVSLNGMFDGGDTVFADSANDGPWDTALTTEFIPKTEAQFRAVGTSAARFVAGHSSGGWAALWLQVTHPEMFAGEWSISPDPVDFRDFIGPDLTRSPPDNFYHDASDKAYGFIRRSGRDTMTLQQWVRIAGFPQRQMHSFDAVFSPAGKNGPMPLFDRASGTIDPAVAAYWETHYDIARVLASEWNALGPQLQGKLHIVVGTDDEFHLDEPARLLQQQLAQLGCRDDEFDFAPGLTHSSIFSYHGSIESYILTEASAALPK